MATAVVDIGDVAHLAVRLPAMHVDVVGEIFPGAGDAGHSACPPSVPSVPTSRATRVTSPAKGIQLVDHGVDGVLELKNLALHVDRNFAREVAASDGGRDVGDVADLTGQVGPAIALTESVRSFHVPATPGTCA